MTAIFERLKRRRHRLDESLTRRHLAHTFSLARYRLHRETARCIDLHAGGDCLDIGSGRSPFKPRLLERGLSVTSLDAEDRSGELDLVGDVQEMRGIADATFDTVLCTQVLEHVPRPWRALAEIERILRPGGRVILSVPHLSLIHEAPHDFFRYTRYGLESLTAAAGLERLEIRATGGLVCFLGHASSLVLMSTAGAVPGLGWMVWALNYAFLIRLAGALDRLVGLAALYPCDYVMVARKPKGAAESGPG